MTLHSSLSAAVLSLLLAACTVPETDTLDRLGDGKPDAETAFRLLKEGNRRFSENHVIHPHFSTQRIQMTDGGDQGKYAYATLLCCSDSRVPPELIFDAGMMDLFVIRVAGNVCHAAEIGSVEYGALHVNTPLVVVMGHAQCGAVTAVSEVVKGCCHHKMEKNILTMVKPIVPVVKDVVEDHPDKTVKEITEIAVVENVKESMKNILEQSEDMREAIASGKIKLLGAVYHLDSREVEWLSEDLAQKMLIND